MDTPLSTLLKDKGYITHYISAQASCYECAIKLSQFKIGALLVMQHEQLQGIVSERDLIQKLLTTRADPTQVPVREIMSTELITLSPEATVREAMRVVTEKRIRHVPILENNKLIGIISIGDLTRWAMLQQENEIAALTGYIHGKG